jgi:hypothetical protein
MEYLTCMCSIQCSKRGRMKVTIHDLIPFESGYAHHIGFPSDHLRRSESTRTAYRSYSIDLEPWVCCYSTSLLIHVDGRLQAA